MLPHCGSLSVVKNGRAHGLQRYLCPIATHIPNEYALARLRPRNAGLMPLMRLE